MYTCIYMYIYICVNIHTYMYIYINTHTHTHTHTPTGGACTSPANPGQERRNLSSPTLQTHSSSNLGAAGSSTPTQMAIGMPKMASISPVQHPLPGSNTTHTVAPGPMDQSQVHSQSVLGKRQAEQTC